MSTIGTVEQTFQNDIKMNTTFTEDSNIEPWNEVFIIINDLRTASYSNLREMANTENCLLLVF